MSRLKLLIETYFEQLGYLICRHRIKTLIAMVLVIAGFISQLPKLTIDTSFEGMFHEKDPLRIQYNRFRDDFGQDRIILVSVRTPDIFAEPCLLKLKALHHEFDDKLPHLDEVKSLINARVTRGEGDTLIVEDLLQDWPGKEIDLAEIRKYAVNNPVYLNDYLSEDGRIAAFIIRPRATVAETDLPDAAGGFDEDDSRTEKETPAGAPSPNRHYLSKQENKAVVEAVNRIVRRFEAPDFEMAIAGGPVSEEKYDRITQVNMARFRKIMMGVIFVFLFLLFRRISGAVYPLIIVYGALFSTMGLMAATGVSVSVFTVILPSFLMAVGIADSVHILAIFYREFQNGRHKYDAIAFAMGHSGFAIVMTSMTTSAGLLSFSFSEIASIGYLGIFAAIGTGLALLYTILLLPAFLALTPIKRKKTRRFITKTRLMDRFLLFFSGLSVTHPVKIMLFGTVLFLAAGIGLSQLRFAQNNKVVFPKTMKIRQDLEFIDENLKGIASVELVVDTKKQNGLYNPVLLKKLDRLRAEIKGMKHGDIYVGKVRSINDILKETNRALHENRQDYYTIPDKRDLVAQELFLFENSGADDLERIVDSQFSKTRISIKMPWPEAVASDRFVKQLYGLYRDELDGLADVWVTGMLHLMGNGMTASIRSMSKSYVLAFCLISLLMIVLIGDLRLGLYSMIPNLLPIWIVMGFMGAFGVIIDLVALMIGSIALGLVVDDTMHFMYNYRRYFDIKKEPGFAVRETLLGTGRAILITSLVLSAGFFVMLFSPLHNTTKFGLYTGIIILVALLADFMVAPALMILACSKKARKERTPAGDTPVCPSMESEPE